MPGRLSAHAKRAPVDRVPGIAFQLDDAAFAVLGQHAASGRAFPAGGGVPGGSSGNHVIRGLNQAVQGFIRLQRAPGGSGNTADARNFKEGSSIHVISMIWYRIYLHTLVSG